MVELEFEPRQSSFIVLALITIYLSLSEISIKTKVIIIEELQEKEKTPQRTTEKDTYFWNTTDKLLGNYR